MSPTGAAVPGNERRRPPWVWAISIFYFLSAGWITLSILIVRSGAIPMTDAQRQYFDSLSPFDYAYTIGLGGLNLVGAVFLLLLRRQAYPCFLCAFVLGLLVTGYQIVAKHWLSAMNPPGLVGVSIGWAIAIAIILYVRALVRRGVLV